jgi:hypothetical protein
MNILTLEDFKLNFPKTSEVHYLLKRLIEYQNSVDDDYTRGFRLIEDGKEAIEAWFGCKQNEMAAFAHNRDGSIYAYWIYGDRTLETSPIIFLGSGCGYSENKILVNSTEDFFRLLSLGIKELGIRAGDLDWEDEVQERQFHIELQASLGIYEIDKIIARWSELDLESLKFQQWLQQELSINQPSLEEYRTIISIARNSHPDLNEWIDRQFEE